VKGWQEIQKRKERRNLSLSVMSCCKARMTIEEGGGGGGEGLLLLLLLLLFKNSNIEHVTVEPPCVRLNNECELSDGGTVELKGISENAL
jgi:hypothetical protein